jgi:predicted alpha/beta superfamily hydrolase
MEEIQQAEKQAPDLQPGIIRAVSATGDLRLHEFRSRVFRNTRFLRIWLPPDYDDAANRGQRYPVLYLNDGQNLFESTTSFTGVEWQADETADRLIRQGAIPPLIMVGLDNAAKDRIREYMPHRSLHPILLRGTGSRYPDFLMKEVMPFVAQNYRVAAGPDNTGLGGSSLGGLISLYTAVVRPGAIGRLLLESPSLWASNRQMIRFSREARHWPERIFLATGTAEAGREDRNRSVVDDVRELAGVFRRAGLDDKRLRLVVEDAATHHESSWAHRFPEALKFLFGNPAI